MVEIQSKYLGVQGRGRHIPVPTEGTWEGVEKDIIALGIDLEGRAGRSILGRGSRTGPGTQLEVKARAERGDEATGWGVPCGGNQGDWSHTRYHADGLRSYSLGSRGPQRNLNRRMNRK